MVIGTYGDLGLRAVVLADVIPDTAHVRIPSNHKKANFVLEMIQNMKPAILESVQIKVALQRLISNFKDL